MYLSLIHIRFADSIRIVKNADEEMSALAATDPSRVALVDARFTDKVAGYNPSQDSSARIRLLSYAPDTLRYEYSAATKRLAVFSEVYYEDVYKRQVLGLILIPVTVFMVYLPEHFRQYPLYAGIIALCIMFIIRILRCFVLLMKKGILLFYTILYLCTIEFLPLLLVGKFAITYYR